MCSRAAILLIVAATNLGARRLPIQVFTSSQGLPRNSVTCLVPSPTGLLWICTSEGLARFDGSRFRVFGPGEGLPSWRIRDLVPSRKGGYWVVTDRGVCRLPAGSRIGERCNLLALDHPAGEFGDGRLLESSSGDTWVATSRGLLRVSANGRTLERTAFPLSPDDAINTLAESPTGTLLVGTQKGVLEWQPGAPARDLTQSIGVAGTGKLLPVTPQDGAGKLLRVSPQEIWMAGSEAIYRLTFQAERRSLERMPIQDPGSFTTLLRSRDGSIWAAVDSGPGSAGIRRVATGADGQLLVAEAYTQADGLPPARIYLLAEDAYGNLWGATNGSGIFRIGSSGFVSYDSNDGLGSGTVAAVFEDPAGRLCVSAAVTGKGPGILIRQGNRFEFSPLRHPDWQNDFGSGWGQVLVPAHDGEWWWAAGRTLLRYPKVARTEDLARAKPEAYDAGSPLGCADVFRVMEDSAGDIWVSCLGPETFTRWDRKTGRFHRWSSAEGWTGHEATVIRDGPGGHLWVGTYDDLLRFHNGRFESFRLTVGPPAPFVTDVLVDHIGRVWIATWHAGLFRCDNPDDPVPVFRSYTVREGLSSNSTASLIEDRAGFIYTGTVRGVDRIDPRAPIESRRVRHFTPADGLPDSEPSAVFRDRQGHLWFGALHGLAEFDPSKATLQQPPEVYVSRVRVRGEDFPLPWEGVRSLSLDLSASRNQVEIEYAGLDLRSPNSLRYQYRLGNSPWSDPVEQLSVNYASLPRGSSRFEVRAVDADGQVSQQPAGIDLFVQSPVWLRWWFLTAMTGAIAGVVALLYNYRVRHLLAIERLRTRIATDLHDDMGASLSQISILSELARKGAEPQLLSDIAEIARTLVADMSDIVWAISPRHDRFDVLVHRMRRFASDTLGGRNIDLKFETTRLAGDSAVPLEIRRPLYLVFKEAVNNVARHSGGSKADIQLAHDGANLKLTVEDDGRGFDRRGRYEGEGLASIARRMREIGGSAEWDSQPGRGTRFTAILPLRARGPLQELGVRIRGAGR